MSACPAQGASPIAFWDWGLRCSGKLLDMLWGLAIAQERAVAEMQAGDGLISSPMAWSMKSMSQAGARQYGGG